ncbi:fatty acid synthase isoform X4 [Acyrthosiphon pisum]|uniref:Ketosynthase family 3 (KS3) domain-containing protein n=1 Tax=Acyrthosiphon pisum TaxID=7029 RepID=A0A8R2D2V5_ACYPI|nr:fatty acid synthase isoform X4 [Acyrthosiphon pisum]|eukprot:XP_016657076.1 PREDICTED: fatty acid synthase isoform X1 [Acyrthosiphon pisum]
MAQHKDEVVISGIGGLFPESNNITELSDLLFQKKNGVTIDSRRWKPNKLGALSGTGKIKNIDTFDPTFFRVHPKLAKVMDTMTKICLERSIEAIIDAGLSPADLHGTNTGVFMGSAISETEMKTMTQTNSSGGSVMLGISRTMQANRISFLLNLTGPSFAMDGGWICGSDGLKKAKEMIENGLLSSAIVGVTNLTLRPELQFLYEGLNRLNKSNQTKPFSSDADGYNRSEACIVLYLQKASEAKRSYGTLLNVKSMQFGNHDGHLTEHDGNHFKSLLLDSYKEADIDPATVDFIEAYGSGIKSEDAMELNIMEEVFCTENRRTPLKLGSVKSNVGHCEVSSLFMSIVKAIITLESGYIPPNINYTGPNNNVAALKNGKIQVITEKTPFVGDIIGISSFGLLNAFSHVILKRNQIVNNLIVDKHNSTNMPQLILVSGRNEENVRETLNQIKSHGNNVEFVSLTNDVFTRNINGHFFRSFNIFPQMDESRIDDVWNISSKRPVWFIFSGMGSQWQGMGTDLMKIPVFANAINKCDVILKPKGVDIKNILTSQNPELFDNVLNSFVGIAAVQIGLVEVLRALDITPDGIIGHSLGELGCAYADGCFTAEEMLLATYSRGQAILETDVIPGMMAAIGLGYDQIKDKLPHDIDVACRNSATSCTISGPVDSINEFVSQLKSEGIFAKSVNVARKAFHSRYIQSAGPTLLKYLKDVIKVPKKRSSKWLSSSLPETEWESDLAKYSSPEYHTNNLLSSVLFEDVLKHIPKDAITIEIAPHGLLQAIIKKALPETVTNIPLTKRVYGDSVRFLLTSIGKMYTSGLNPKIKEVYPTIQYPVSRGTPSIFGLPFWDHTEKWSDGFLDLVKSGERIICLVLDDDKHLAQYQFQGQHIIPFSFILFNVWKTFIEINSKSLYEKSIQFQNLRFKNNVKIHPTDSYHCYIMIQLGSGLFECDVDNEVILSGEIRILNNIVSGSNEEKSINFDNTTDNLLCNVSENEIYSILKNNGFNLGFKNITNLNIYKNNIQGSVKWENNWIYFLECLFKFPFLDHLGTGPIEIPVYIREMFINPALFENHSEKDISVNYNKLSNEVTCDGIKILGVKNAPISLPILNSVVVKVQEKSFTKFNNLKCKNLRDFVVDSMDIIMETDKSNLETSGKIILSTPYHYDDLIAKSCTNEIKEIVENKFSMNSKTINWENIKDVSDVDESARFITVSNVNYLQDTMRALANKKNIFIIVCSLKKLQEPKDWKIITQQEFDNNSCLTLMKKIIRLEDKSIFIKPTNDNYDLSIWRALETNNSSNGKIYIISMSEPLEGISIYVKEMLHKYKSKELRFLFILDTNAPNFESNKSFYAHQLSKDLLVNIYNNGDWGFYKSIDLQDIKDDIKVNKNLVLKNFIINNKNKLTVNYLGLNFKDLVLDENTENDFGPFEYSGHINNKTTIGIASINKMSSQIIYDPVLSWPIPSAWSLQEATTVPLAYALSYYALNILSTLQKDKTVLVTSGLNPIGQAAISISLDMKCQTYVIVDSDQQAEQLSVTFPQLSRSKILINKNNTFDVHLKMITKSKGIDCILNFLSGESFYAAVRALAAHGNFFNFSKLDMKKQRYLGSRIFNFSTSFFSIGSSRLLNENIENKQILQQAFINGLNKGVIKPFRSHVVTTLSSGNNLFDTMRINASSITYKKVLLSINDNTKDNDCSKLNEKVECNMYECHHDKIYLIVGNRGDWLDLAEWLAERGAKRIMIVVKRCSMSSTVCRRFDQLISRNVSIQIESDLHLKTKEESLNWLNYLTSSKELGALFIVNQSNDSKISNLRYSFEKLKSKIAATPFICILSKAEHICAELKSIGFNALNISWDGPSTEPKNTETILASLDFLLQNSNTSESYSFICSKENNNTSKWSYQMNDLIANFFPESANELHLLNKKIAKEAGFIEVATRSPRLSQLKSVSPVFVIPGLKPKSIESFYKQFFYPVFEAQYPEDITSIDNLAETLVNKLKSISDHGYVSIIGECWGGIIALKIAQILEAQGILVTVTLLEFDSEFLTGWAQRFRSNNDFAMRLNVMFSSSYTEFTKSKVQINDSKMQLIVSYHQKILEENTQRALNLIWSLLRIFLESKPQSNRLHSKVLIFRYERKFEFNRTNLNDYCIKPPVLSIIPKPDYKSMLEDKRTIDAITKNVTHLYPVGIELSLSEKYKNVYFNADKIFNT